MNKESAKDIFLESSSRKRLEELEKCLNTAVDIQCEHGNWDFSPYMMGFANGLLLAQACLLGKHPEFKERPERWIQDMDPHFKSELYESSALGAVILKSAAELRSSYNG